MNLRKPAAIRALAAIEEHKADLAELEAALGRVRLWRPAAGLVRLCRETLAMIESLKARFDRKLIVTIVGPCGSGKSTLLNALAGEDDLSPTGVQRPTTRQVVAYCRHSEDAQTLREALEPGTLSVQPRPSASGLDNLVLVDTPDVDSFEQQAHIPVVRRVVGQSDVLVCVFNAENPKTRDTADFFAPFVRWFGGEALVAVLNKCDRLDAAELTGQILPDFRRYIDGAWERPVEQVFCLSARSHMKQPQWDPMARPRHGFDQFREFSERIFGSLNRAGAVVDRRLENARQIRDFMGSAVLEAVDADRQALREALRLSGEAEAGVREAVGLALVDNSEVQRPLVTVGLYQRLSRRWVGPVARTCTYSGLYNHSQVRR